MKGKTHYDVDTLIVTVDFCKRLLTLDLAIVRCSNDVNGRLTVTYMSTYSIRQECPTIGVNLVQG